MSANDGVVNVFPKSELEYVLVSIGASLNFNPSEAVKLISPVKHGIGVNWISPFSGRTFNVYCVEPGEIKLIQNKLVNGELFLLTVFSKVRTEESKLSTDHLYDIELSK